MTENDEFWEHYFPDFFHNTEPGIKQLKESASRVNIPSGQHVFYPGSLCENYLLMLEGCVKTQLISENGREVLLYYVRSGDSCVLTTSCLLGGDRYPAEGITEGSVNAFVISAKEFHLCLDRSTFFRQFVFKNFALRLSNVISRMEEVVFGPIDLRLSKLLLATNKMLITKTHQEIASDLGTAREVVSRHLKRFEAYGWVILSRGSIEIMDFIALRNLSREDS